MTYDPNSLLKVPKDIAEWLLFEEHQDARDEQAKWARYGRDIHRILHSDQFSTAIRNAMLRHPYPPEMAKRLRRFLARAVANE